MGIEIDGESHSSQLEYDKERTKFLNSINIKIIRIANDDVKNNLLGVKQYLEEIIKKYDE